MITTTREASVQEVDEALRKSWGAYNEYKKKNLKERAEFMRAIAAEMESVADQLIDIANQETSLGEARLKTELVRTQFQLSSYANACEKGSWLDIRIDTPLSAKKNGIDKKTAVKKNDLRKMLVPLGPVVVFGASNFPFAYSTAGGDTACALAAGCPVIIKAHPAHAQTSEMVAEAVQRAAQRSGLSESVFIHLHGGFETGRALVQHPLTSAVGFTGSFEGGKSLFDLAQKRAVPIPVFAEMGSVNPIFILPKKLKHDAPGLASLMAESITQSAGQFCTNPGILVGIEDEVLEEFERLLGERIETVRPQKMLHPGIAQNFLQKREKLLAETSVELAAVTEFEAGEEESIPTLAEVSAKTFLKNRMLHHEVFGPLSLLVKCEDINEMVEVARSMEGQLTSTLIASDEELLRHEMLVDALKSICGRLILNGVPTGVEVALSMHHGGPFPATTDSRFTAVGADGIKRFARPLCFQNWTNELLPPELKNENTLGLWRTVNDELTREPIR
ncbi:MAG: aldehyde dehydrogenase (NADP(+)) [Flavisolibacter sp.]